MQYNYCVRNKLLQPKGSTVVDQVQEARKELRKLQMTHGHLIEPETSMLFNNIWEEALAKDPEGSQLKYLVEEFKELLTPMQT